jgi:hypothetical protein
MPDPRDISDDEKKALIAKIVKSEAFKGTEDLPKLLRYLADNADKLLSAKDIEALHYRRADQHFKPSHSRERVSKLKERLDLYAAETPDDVIGLELPDAPDVGGYQLQYRRRTEPTSVCRRFWAAHLASDKEVRIVCDPLLFFWDGSKEMMFRFVDTNAEGFSRKAALHELDSLHKKEYQASLIPGPLYIDVGSVVAAESIREYFRSAGAHVPMAIDERATRDWLKVSPVVIGNARTNSAIRSIFGSPAHGFSYRLDAGKYTSVQINSPTQDEIQALGEIGMRAEKDGRFSVTSSDVTIGIVTRMHNPRGAGVMTFIASDGTFTTKQMAAALTDEKQLRTLFTRMGWHFDRAVPEAFEMMFFVRLWPGDIHDEVSEAKLIFWRAANSH